MKTLAAVTYFQNNKRRVIALLIAVALGVFLIYTLQALFGGVFSIERQANLAPLRHFSRVRFSERQINDDLLLRIKQHWSTDQVMWAWTRRLSFHKHLGGFGSGTMYFLAEDKLKTILTRLNLKLTTGRLPLRRGEIVINEQHFINLGWEWNDRVIEMGYTGPILLKATGLVEGDSALALGKLDPAIRKAKKVFRRELLVLPKAGNRAESNSFLASLDQKEIAATTYQQQKESCQQNRKELRLILNVVMLLVVVVLIVTTATTSYIHYYQRREEFGILYALGYTRLELAAKICREVLLFTGVGFGLGVSFSLLFISLLNYFSFAETGFPISVWNGKAFLRSTIVPLFVLGFSIAPLAGLIKDLDAINVIERRH